MSGSVEQASRPLAEPDAAGIEAAPPAGLPNDLKAEILQEPEALRVVKSLPDLPAEPGAVEGDPSLGEQFYAAAARGNPVAEALALEHAKPHGAAAKRQTRTSSGHDRRKTVANEPEAPVKDYGHAAVLARHFLDNYRWAAHRGAWMAWTGKVWQPIEEERVAKLAADTLRADYAVQLAMTADRTNIGRLTALIHETCIYSRIIGALSFLKGWDFILTRFEEWDADAWALNAGSDIIDPHEEKEDA